MRKDLQVRLAKVAKKVLILKRLHKFALSEEQMIERMAERSKKVLLGARGKLFRVIKMLEPVLGDNGRQALSELEQEITKIVTNAGVVNTSELERVNSADKELWKDISSASKGSMAVFHFFTAFSRFKMIAMLSSRLQNAEQIELAKQDPRYRSRIYKAVESIAEVMPVMQSHLEKAKQRIPEIGPPEAPKKKEQEPKQDTTALESVKKKLNDIEGTMRGIVEQMSRVILSKAEDLYGRDDLFPAALDENMASAYFQRRVNSKLNRDRDFYDDVLHLQTGPSHVDIGEFLDSRNKKILYQAYRSFVMAARALGILQTAKTRPEVVLNSEKAQALVRKAQKILQKRKDLLVKYINGLTAEDDEEEEDKGIPKGTFTDTFDEKSEKVNRESVPKGTFDTAA